MTTLAENSNRLVLGAGLAFALSGCGTSAGDAATSGATGGEAAIVSGGRTGTGGEGAVTGGLTGNGGATGLGGASVVTGGTTSGGVSTGGVSTGGVSTGGGTSNGGSSAGTSGASTSGAGGTSMAGASTGQGGATTTGDNCTVGKWPAADPTAQGPYTTVTENEVGPEAGAAEDGIVPKFTLFRPKDLGPNGLCHPVITWGNGTGATPNLYKSLLALFASHGFVVIASNSKNVAQGDPKPMLVGVTWVLQQNEDPASALYHHLDATHIGATGHSQGAVATSQAAGDSRITTNVPIEGAQVQRNLHGPAMFFCGGLDDIVGCSGAQSALNAVTTLPAMYAEYLSVDHGSWMAFGSKPSPVYAAVNAWMRVHLMADDALRPWFYGASCQVCTDSGWQIQQKNMAQ